MRGNYLVILEEGLMTLRDRMTLVAEEAEPVGVRHEVLVGDEEKFRGGTGDLLDLVPQAELEGLRTRKLPGDRDWDPFQIVKEGPIPPEDLLDLVPRRLQDHQRKVLEFFDFFFGSLSPDFPPLRLGERNGGIDEVVKGRND